MNEKSMTTINLKKINRAKVYQYIYNRGPASKLQIVQDLQMGLSTVSQNLNALEKEGLIERSGYFDSTGGRKAQAIRIVSNFKLSIGIGIMKDMIHITAINLYGEPVCTETFPVPYENTEQYYTLTAEKIMQFISQNHYLPEQILGISIATQGIISIDGTTVTYGKIMNNFQMNLEDFSSRLPYPCHLIHDSKAAAALELWKHQELDSALVFLLNHNLGGAVITNRFIHQGYSMHSGCIEHMCMDFDGPLCYCGNKGCLETYCSVNALEKNSKMSAKDFFSALRDKKKPSLKEIWEDYLMHLAFAIRNLNMAIDCPVILSGYLAPYFIEEDIQYLLENVNHSSPFPLSRNQILLGTQGQFTPAIGAALYYVDNFLHDMRTD